MAFEDPTAEMTCVAGVVRYGRDAFVDCEGFFKSGDLVDEVNQMVWACAEDLYADGSDRKLDYPTLLGIARKKGFADAFRDDDAKEYFASLKRYPAELESVAPEAAKLLKLKVGRELDRRLAQSRKSLNKMSGDESLAEILAIVESPLFEYTATLGGQTNETRKIGVGMRDWLDNVIASPCENLGIPSPFPKYNELIGGGLRRRGISMIGARPKVGKSALCDNFALHVSGTLGIPALNLDTEMSDDEHWARILAHLTGVPIKRIEQGDVTAEEAARLRQKTTWLESVPYYYRSVLYETFEEQVAAMRRWAIKDVGVDADGRRKDCVIIYDYLQATDAREFSGNKFAEYQLLGFNMVVLSQLAKKYDVPLLVMLQLNRDGIDKRTTAVAAGSDRIVWKCSNFSILFKMEPEEVEVQGASEGTLWLANLIARHGKGGSGPNDDIAIAFDGATARMTEGKTRGELQKKVPSTKRGFEVDDEDDEPENGALAKLRRSERPRG